MYCFLEIGLRYSLLLLKVHPDRRRAGDRYVRIGHPTSRQELSLCLLSAPLGERVIPALWPLRGQALLRLTGAST